MRSVTNSPCLLFTFDSDNKWLNYYSAKRIRYARINTTVTLASQSPTNQRIRFAVALNT